MRRRLRGLATSAALHGVVAALLLVGSAPPRRSAQPERHEGTSRKESLTIFVVPPEPRSLPGLRPDDADDDPPAQIEGRQAVVSIPGLTLSFQKVAARARLLFPLIVPGLALEQFLPAGSRDRPDSLPNPFAASRNDRGDTPPLLIDQSSAQAIVDRSWSRHERWRAFQNLAAILAKYDADDGDLPKVLQMYFDQNGLQPFVENGGPDAKLWAQLAVAADHVDFIGVISRYASMHSASRATTSLLLVLDTLLQSNLDVLLTLLSLDPVADLQLTRRANKAAFDFVVETQRRYRLELARRRLDSIDAVRTFCDAIRLAILDTAVRTTPGGYRSGDARYVMGAIYWRQGNATAAIDQWRAIAPDDSDSYARFYSAIRHALEQSSDVLGAKAAIDDALSAERSQWRSLSYDRLNRFGYRFDTF